ncbi:MAG TPA: adenylate/guanylate cyclase domain-containing protein [Solirubrobacteraceae bacterium]
MTASPGFIGALLAAPLAGFWLLLAAPSLDVHWEQHPAHFWLVLGAAAINASLAFATGDAARYRGDARLFLVSLAFLAAAGFLGLHALATPGVLVDGRTAGFVIATPVGLLVAAGFAAASSDRFDGERGRAVMRHAQALRGGLLAVMAAWAAVSVARLPPLDSPSAAEVATGPLAALAVSAVGLYGLAAWRYLALYRRRRASMLLGVTCAFVLLAEAMIAVAFARNWHATWWEWHLLMLAAFALVALSARHEWREERFSPLYLGETAAGKHEVSVIFADLCGFTSFSEHRDPREVSAMLNAYFEVAIPPVVREHGGEIDRLVGDQIMATFNRRGDQPDHALRAARAALAIQEATSRVAAAHPSWPRFRVGVNTGEAMVGVLGAAGGKSYTVIGDAVNVAARLEASAPLGRVAIGAATLRRLPRAQTESLGPIRVKGKAEPVDAYVLEQV